MKVKQRKTRSDENSIHVGFFFFDMNVHCVGGSVGRV